MTPVANLSRLTPRTALFFGLVCLACGVPPVLGALGFIPFSPTPGTPTWIAIAAGMVFVLAGLMLMVDAAAGGTNDDGSLPAAASPILHHLQTLIVFAIIVVMGTIATWISIGPGERHFSTTISAPFLTYRPKNTDLPGRIAFGIGAALIWIVMLMGIASAIRKHVGRMRSA